MHTFPSPPLKFRTVGFPQYGFKLDSSATIFVSARTAERQIRFSRFPGLDLYAANRPDLYPYSPYGHEAGPSARTLQSRGPWLASGLCCPTGSPLTMASCAPLPPSHRFMSYAVGPCPCDLARAGPGEGPQFTPCVCALRAAFRTPMDRTVAFGCFFTAHTGLRRIRIGSASTFPTHDGSRVSVSRGCKVSFMVRPDELASPSPPRTFTFELSPPESPHRDVEYHYAGKQPTSRGRTCTGKTHSLMGCKRMNTNKPVVAPAGHPEKIKYLRPVLRATPISTDQTRSSSFVFIRGANCFHSFLPRDRVETESEEGFRG